MRAIQLQYSLDGGTSFATAVSYDLLELWCDLQPEIETDGANKRTMGSTAVKCQKPIARVKVDMVFAWSNFNPKITATAELKSKFLQTWLCAPLRRLYIASGSSHFTGGWTFFDSASNTNYLNVLNSGIEYEKFFEPDNTIKILGYKVECEMRNPYALTLWNGSAWV